MSSPDPQANPRSIITFARARFTILTPQMIRLEYAPDGLFEDRPTLAVANRRLPAVAAARTKISDRTITLDTGALTLRYTADGRPFSPKNLSASFRVAGRTVRWRPGLKDHLNLKGTTRTLDNCDADRFLTWPEYQRPGLPVKLSDGLISRSGWALFDDSANILLDRRPDADRPWVTPRPACGEPAEPAGPRQDLYLLAYGHDYRAALADAARVFGAQPLPPRYALGYWYSRYWAYTDLELEQLVRQFDTCSIPLDVLVIDMDWHLKGWTGYTWDKNFFPDPDETLRWLKERHLKITLNLHPAEGVGKHEDAFRPMCRALGLDPARTDRVPLDVTDPLYMKYYFKLLHHPHEARGVDFWWMDWQQGATTKMPGLDTLPWINRLHWEDLAHNPRRHGLRPLCFSRFGGLGAGRYPVGFSGDTFSTWTSLAYQPYFTATAANVLYGYWSHDIGGHSHMLGDLTPELYARWMQFGAFSPILRTHACKSPALSCERRVWMWPAPFSQVMADTLRRRYEMVPYIYTENRKCCDSGVSLVRPMYYHWPEDDAAYAAPQQYMFGDSLLVAPVVAPADAEDEMAPVSLWLPDGPWFDLALGQLLRGGRRLRRRYLIDEIPVFARPGAVLPGQIASTRLLPGSYPNLLLTIVPGPSGSYDLYEDDGLTTDYADGKSASITFAHHATKSGRTISVAPARGSFTGFLKRRSLEIRLPASAPPKAVKVAGKTLPWRHRLAEKSSAWTYDAQTATTIIRLAAFDITRRLTLTVLADPAQPARLADGLAGLLRRLELVGRHNNLASPVISIHPDERLAVETAQTGNRISRRPETFSSEIRRLRRLLKKLPTALREYHDLYLERNQPDQAAYLARARAVLKTTLAQF